ASDEAFLLALRRMLARYQFVELSQKSNSHYHITYFDGRKKQEVKILFGIETKVTCPVSLESVIKEKFKDESIHKPVFSKNDNKSIFTRSEREMLLSRIMAVKIAAKIFQKEIQGNFLIEVGSKHINRRCVICLRSIQADEKIISCPFCDAKAHVNHLRIWLRSKDTCPNCRKQLI
ncbi:MAG: RING finger domain-containing protein, partial [Candidatus Kariarchaeaceae archaeon]